MSFMKHYKSGEPPCPSWRFMGFSFLGTLIAIGITGWLSIASGYLWIIPPFGSSCILLFGVSDSPFAQPRNLIGGHLVSALAGILVLNILGDAWWSGAFGVALALAFMQMTRTIHPPAGANPLVVIAAHASPSFLLIPVLSGSIILLLVALVINNLRAPKSYPRYWI
jgi:CBS-domain-containing membrane protein